MKYSVWTRTLATGCLAAVFASACGQVEGPDYGEPLATLKGLLTWRSAEVSSTAPVRLALAWYPSMVGAGAPKAIFTEDVEYQGTFPLNYTFDIYRLPPAAALGDMSAKGGPKKAAVGYLIAYSDTNGNRQLDTIPASGIPIDTVLGVSGPQTMPGLFSGDITPDDEFMKLVYVEQPGEPDSDSLTQALSIGFNLVQMRAGEDPRVVPLSSSVPIELTSDPKLNVWVCEEIVDPAVRRFVCGMDLLPSGPGDGINEDISGFLEIDELGAYVTLDIFDNQGLPVQTATVSVDGIQIPSDDFSYRLEGEVGVLLKFGWTHQVVWSLPGKAPRQVTVAMPGDFTITSPTASSQLVSGEIFTAAWSPSSGAAQYSLDLFASGTNSGTTVTSSEPIVFDPNFFEGEATFRMIASSPNGPGYSDHPVGGRIFRTVDVTFAQ